MSYLKLCFKYQKCSPAESLEMKCSKSGDKPIKVWIFLLLLIANWHSVLQLSEKERFYGDEYDSVKLKMECVRVRRDFVSATH